jgi:glutathione S-transferase
MQLFYSRISGNSARAVFALFEAGVVWQPSPIDPRAGENRQPEYLTRNPMGKLPALEDGELRLWESNAINWYVAEKHPEARLLPSDTAGRARVLRWQFFQSAHVSPACLPISRATNPRMRAFWKVAADEQATLAARAELARYLPVLDEALDERDWLEGDFSLADIAYAPHLFFIQEGGFDFSPYPHIRTWLARLFARPAWSKTVALVLGEG